MRAEIVGATHIAHTIFLTYAGGVSNTDEYKLYNDLAKQAENAKFISLTIFNQLRKEGDNGVVNSRLLKHMYVGENIGIILSILVPINKICK